MTEKTSIFIFVYYYISSFSFLQKEEEGSLVGLESLLTMFLVWHIYIY